MRGETIDMRVIVGDGKTISLVRGSRHPMTNLHIGGARSAPHALIQRIRNAVWREVLETACVAAKSLPRSDLKCFDIALLACGRKHVLLEANVFGDYLKDAPMDPHRVLAAMIERGAAEPAKAGAAA
jgi:hypothetical protein